MQSAFLQGQSIKRQIFLQPPVEFKVPGLIWKLNKTVYGLSDAYRMWYLTVKSNVENLGCRQTLLDPALYVKSGGGGTSGMISTHVDDF